MMRKSNLFKAMMLGLCLTAIPTGTAFAQLATSTAPAVRGESQSDELDALYKKQAEIDQYLLVDHAKEIEDKGFMINYTNVVDNYIEIGISPYTDENAEFIYGVFGNDNVKVVEFDQSIMYASNVGTADPVAVDGTASDDQTVKDEMQANLEDTNTATAENDKVYKNSDVQIQIESTTAQGAPDDVAPVADSSVVYETLSADAGQDNSDIQTVSAAEDLGAVKRVESESEKGASAPILVLAIAGGAALIGGAILTTNKKKSTK